MVDLLGGTFEWPLSNGDFSESNILNPKEIYAFSQTSDGSDGFSIDYYYTASSGCVYYTSEYITPSYFVQPPDVSITTVNSNCLTNNGAATVAISGNAPPFDVYWSTGATFTGVTTSTVDDLGSGVYYANVSDANGCVSIGTAQVSDAELGVIADTILPETCNNADGYIDLTVTSANSISQTFWSSGATTEDMYGHAGEYTVMIEDVAGCIAFQTYHIPGSPMSVVVDDTYNADCSGGQGYINITTDGGNQPYTWSWTGPGGYTAMTEDVTGLDMGIYTCTVTDSSGCVYSWSKAIEAYDNTVYPYVSNVVNEDCGASNGEIDMYVSGTPLSWEWSTGSTDEDLTDLSAGDYVVTYSDASGCVSNKLIKVKNVKPYQPQICLLTVDTSLTYNEIVWEKDPLNVVDGYNIYRETTTYGDFELVASLDYSHESVYTDNAASPMDRSWRYYITSFDACGESDPSLVHKTIHIVIESTDLVNYNLSWDEYEGISYTSVDLMRYTDVDGWQTIANLPVGTNQYTDTPPSNTGLDYMVSFNLSSPCVSTKAQDHNATRSNKTSSAFNPGGPTDVGIIEKEEGQILMYPNPTTGQLNVYISDIETYNYIKIVNMNGAVVYEGVVTDDLSQIDLGNYQSGIYFVQIFSDTHVVTEKVVKN